MFFYLENRQRTLASPTDKIMLSLDSIRRRARTQKAQQRTYDAMLRKAKAGHVTGGHVFGNDQVDVAGAEGRRSHMMRRINARQAAVVHTFELSVAALP